MIRNISRHSFTATPRLFNGEVGAVASYHVHLTRRSENTAVITQRSEAAKRGSQVLVCL